MVKCRYLNFQFQFRIRTITKYMDEFNTTRKVHVNFRKAQYVVTYVSNGVTLTTIQRAFPCKKLSLENPTKRGRRLRGW